MLAKGIVVKDWIVDVFVTSGFSSHLTGLLQKRMQGFVRRPGLRVEPQIEI